MPVISYPDYALPLPRRAVSLDDKNDLLRTEFEAGFTRQLRRTDSNRKLVSVQWNFTANQYYVWRAFVFAKLVNGASFFTMDLRIDSTLSNYTVRLVNGDSRARANDDGSYYTVSAILEIEDLEYNENADDYFSALEALQEDGTQFLLDQNELYEIINVDYPTTLPA